MNLKACHKLMSYPHITKLHDHLSPFMYALYIFFYSWIRLWTAIISKTCPLTIAEAEVIWTISAVLFCRSSVFFPLKTHDNWFQTPVGPLPLAATCLSDRGPTKKGLTILSISSQLETLIPEFLTYVQTTNRLWICKHKTSVRISNQ